MTTETYSVDTKQMDLDGVEIYGIDLLELKIQENWVLLWADTLGVGYGNHDTPIEANDANAHLIKNYLVSYTDFICSWETAIGKLPKELRETARKIWQSQNLPGNFNSIPPELQTWPSVRYLWDILKRNTPPKTLLSVIERLSALGEYLRVSVKRVEPTGRRKIDLVYGVIIGASRQKPNAVHIDSSGLRHIALADILKIEYPKRESGTVLYENAADRIYGGWLL